MLPMAATTMTICACALGVTRSFLMRRWKEGNECRCGTAKTRNAGCASTMNGTSVRAGGAGFVLAVVGAFVGRSFGYVRLACWCVNLCRVQEMACCSVCGHVRENRDNLLCSACQALFG